MSERQTLPLLGLGRGESRRTRRACGTAMRSCASLSRGVAAPLGCVIPLLFLSQQRWVSRFWSAASLAYRKLSACSLVTAVRFLTAKNGVDYKFSLHFLPGLWYTCLRNKCHAISTVCLQLRESVGYRYRRCVLCSYLEEALTHTVTHTTKRVDGNSGEDRAYLPQYTELKASKSLKKQQAECPDTLRNQQVMCSSHTTSSKSIESFGFRCFFVVKIRKR